jgi:hypothetical protein
MTTTLMRRLPAVGVYCVLGLTASNAATADGTRQLATGGATQIEGSAGGGLTPWATISGYTTREEIGATAFATRVDTGDYQLSSYGVAAAFNNRLEVSLARQQLDLLTLGPALGLPGAKLEQDIVGVKVRLFGDVLYTAVPQVALGVQYKKQREFLIPNIVGASDDSSFDLYASATKVFLAGVADTNAFINTTVRWTEANETGLLGFGGPDGSRHVEFEGSAGLLLSRRFAAGVEFRSKSSNLPGLPEDHWRDVFVGWFPNRHVSMVLAYVDLGTIATLPDQTGWYLSIQGAF